MTTQLPRIEKGQGWGGDWGIKDLSDSAGEEVERREACRGVQTNG